MSAVILRIATRYLSPVLLIVSAVLLVRGHNDPGGGFIGGLLAASGLALQALAYGSEHARQLLRYDPRTFIGGGLLLALSSGIPALLSGAPWLTGYWWKPELPLLGALPLGTPLWFDIGIYFTVIGFTLTIVFALAEHDEREST